MSLFFRMIGWLVSIGLAIAALGSVIGEGPAFATGLCMAGLAVAINPHWRVSILRRFVSFSILFLVTALVMGMEVQPSGLAEFSAQAMFVASLVILIIFAVGRTKTPINKSEFTKEDLNHLIVLCKGALQDDVIDQEEAEAFRNLFRSNPGFEDEPRIRTVVMAVEKALDDGKYDANKTAELRNIINEFYDYILDDESSSREAPDSDVPDSDVSAPDVLDSNVTVEKVGHDITELAPPAPGDVFTITYNDVFGIGSERKIKYRSVSKDGDDIYIEAFCFDTRAYCTLRVDRITEATNTESGVRFTDAGAYFAYNSGYSIPIRN